MKKLIILFIFYIILTPACCREKKYYIIPKNERFNMQLLDTAIFISNLNVIDTFYVSMVFERISPYHPEASNHDCGPLKYGEEIHITYAIINNNTEKTYFGLVQNIKEDGTIINNFRRKGDETYVKTYNRYTLNNVKYKHVFEYKGNNDIIKIFANPEFGILSFEKDTGEIFYLEKYIKSNNIK